MSQFEAEYNANNVNFFTPVSSELYQEIMDNLRKNTVPVAFKILNVHGKTNFVPVEDAELGMIRKFEGDLIDTPIMCSFTYLENRYFFKTKVNTSDVYFFMNFPEKIYKIQRRNDFRVSVPTYLDHKVKILEYPKFENTLIDISLGGCRISIVAPQELELLEETDLSIEIEILSSNIQNLTATIVFIQYIPEQQKQIIGVKFGQLPTETASLLHSTLIQVDRAIRHREL